MGSIKTNNHITRWYIEVTHTKSNKSNIPILLST